MGIAFLEGGLKNPESLNINGCPDIHLGDATLLAALNTLATGKSALVIDPNEDLINSILDELKKGKPVFTWLEKNKQVNQEYASLFQNPKTLEKIRKIYRETFSRAKKHLGKLQIYPATFKQTLSMLPLKVNLITYHYPSRSNPLVSPLKLAGSLLKPNGVFVVTSENSEIIRTYQKLASQFVTSCGYINRTGPYVSAYDIVYGKNGRYQIKIKNTNGDLPKHISEIEKNIFLNLAYRFEQ